RMRIGRHRTRGERIEVAGGAPSCVFEEWIHGASVLAIPRHSLVPCSPGPPRRISRPLGRFCSISASARGASPLPLALTGLEYPSPLHHERDVLQGADVPEGIPLDGDDVRLIARR